MLPPPSSPSVSSTLQAFLDWFEVKVSAGARSSATLAMHREHAGWLLRSLGAETPIASLDGPALERWCDDERAGRRGRPVANSTLRKRASTLRQALELEHRRGRLERLPVFPEIEATYVPKVTYLRNDIELGRLCYELPPHREAWIQVAVWSGMHPSDVNRLLAWTECDPFASPPWFLTRNTKNRRGPRPVEMPAPLAEFLRRWFRDRNLRPGEPVVPSWPNNLRAHCLRPLSKKLGLMPMSGRALRHTCATWAVHELKSVPKALAEYLGHSSTTMIERVYAHALPPAFGEVAAALSGFAAGARRPAHRFDGNSPVEVGGRKPAKRKAPVRELLNEISGGGQEPGGRANVTRRGRS